LSDQLGTGRSQLVAGPPGGGLCQTAASVFLRQGVSNQHPPPPPARALRARRSKPYTRPPQWAAPRCRPLRSPRRSGSRGSGSRRNRPPPHPHDPHRPLPPPAMPSARRCPRTASVAVGDASPRFSTYRATNIDLATDSTGSPHRRCNRRRSGDGCMRRRTFFRPDENHPYQIRLHENHLRQ
jgi:hypothetical protein